MKSQLFDDDLTNQWLNALSWKGLNLNFSEESKISFKRELRQKVKEWLMQKRQEIPFNMLPKFDQLAQDKIISELLEELNQP